jgi:amidophosphoribosyltransferase
MLREAGALEVHVRIASPPVRWPCFYGIDFATRAELVASGLDVEGVRRSIGADTLGYISLDGLIAASEQPRSRLCTGVLLRRLPDPAARGGEAGKAPAGRPRAPRRSARRRSTRRVRRPATRAPCRGRRAVRRQQTVERMPPERARDGLLTTVSSWGAAGALDRP